MIRLLDKSSLVRMSDDPNNPDYHKQRIDFSKLGLGVISDAEKCTVEEELNGSFELTMRYPVKGARFKDLKASNVIVCKSNPYSKPQAFRIVHIEKNIDMTIEITAEHVSYQLSHIPVMSPCKVTSADEAFEYFTSNAMEPCPFTLTVNDPMSELGHGEFSFNVPTSLRSMLADGDETVQGVFGGEYTFDNYDVILEPSRGNDNGAKIRYGVDLIDMRQEENLEEVFTGIAPYWKGSVTQYSNTNQLPITIENGNWMRDRYEKEEDSARRCAIMDVTAGTEYMISTSIASFSDTGVIYYDASQNVVGYDIVRHEIFDEGETTINHQDYKITVPKNAVKMAINSCTTAAPIVVKDEEVLVVLTIENGYWWCSPDYAGIFAPSNDYRTGKITVKPGDKYKLTTVINNATIPGIVFYNRSNRVISYDLAGTGTAEVITDHEFSVPDEAVYMAVNSLNTSSPVLYGISSTTSTDVDSIVTLSEKVVHSENAGLFPYYRTLAYDASSEFDYQPSEAMLRTWANWYVQQEGIGVPKVSIEISAVDFGKVVASERPNTMWFMRLGDIVTVEFPLLEVESKAKIVKTTYDVLRDEYTDFELGEPQKSISGTIASMSSSSSSGSSGGSDELAASAFEKATAAEAKANEALNKAEMSRDHRQLSNREAEKQHPISSVTRLSTELDSRVHIDDRLTNSEIEDLLV